VWRGSSQAGGPCAAGAASGMGRGHSRRLSFRRHCRARDKGRGWKSRRICPRGAREWEMPSAGARGEMPGVLLPPLAPYSAIRSGSIDATKCPPCVRRSSIGATTSSGLARPPQVLRLVDGVACHPQILPGPPGDGPAVGAGFAHPLQPFPAGEVSCPLCRFHTISSCSQFTVPPSCLLSGKPFRLAEVARR
jgi:hypothetical protein